MLLFQGVAFAEESDEVDEADPSLDEELSPNLESPPSDPPEDASVEEESLELESPALESFESD